MQRTKVCLWLVPVLILTGWALAWSSGVNVPVQTGAERLSNSLMSLNNTKISFSPGFSVSQVTPAPNKIAGATGGISGYVTKAAGGGGILGVTVRASLQECPSYSEFTTTAADGFYTITGLPAGNYEVWTDNDSDYVDIYWNNKTWQNADLVTVSNSVVPNINFSLRLGGKITGTITLTGSFMVSALILAWDAVTIGTDYYATPYSAGSTADYTIKRLPTGTYKLKTFNGLGYIDVYFNDKVNWATADVVSVTEGATTSGKNFTLSLGGTIEGTVSSASKAPLEDISLWGYNVLDKFEWINFGYTDVDGNYSITGLRSGDWKVFCMGDETYAFEWYNNKSSWNTADVITIAAPGTVSNKDFSLAVGGSISGYVYDAGGSPLSGCSVAAYETSFVWGGMAVKEDETAGDGSYMITGLATGVYYVEASTDCSEQWWDHESSILNADIVSVTQPGNTSGINFNMPSAVEDEAEQTASIPESFELKQNHPNPFNPGTEIQYSLRRPGYVTLEVYNLLGQKIKTLVDEYQAAGSHDIPWDGRNEAGNTVSSGVYFYKLLVNGSSQVKRMVLLK